MSTEAAPHILVVDDEPEVCDLLSSILTSHGFRISRAGSAAEARRIIDDGDLIDVAVIDAVLPGELGALLAEQVHHLGVPVILISGNPDAMRHEVLEHVPCVRLSKPFRAEDIEAAVLAAIQTHSNAGERDTDADARADDSDALVPEGRR